MVEKQIFESGSVPLKHAKILRGPYQMAIDVTNKCNFRCLHCYNRSGENPQVNKELTYDEKMDFIRDIAKLKPYNLCFCGGEPMLEEKFLYEAAKVLSSNGIMVSMVTNGSLVKKEKAIKLKEAGVKRAQVSLDGARPETHERLRQFEGSFEKAKNAIKYFKEAGFSSVGVAFSPTSFNWYELEDAYNLSVSLGATEFRVQPLMLLGRTLQQEDPLCPNPLHYRFIVKTIQKLQNQKRIRIEWGDPIDHLIRFRSRLEHFGAFSNVQADGEIIVSPYIPLSVGNIRRHKFSEYWNAGLVRAWEIPKIKEFASKIVSIEDMGKTDENVPKVWYEDNVQLDLIDDNLINMEV